MSIMRTSASFTAIDKNVVHPVVIPIVDNAFHDIGAAAGRHVTEKIAGLYRASRFQLATEETTVPRPFEHMRQVRQLLCHLLRRGKFIKIALITVEEQRIAIYAQDLSC